MAHLNLELDDNFSLVISNDPTLFSLYKSSYQHLDLQPVVRLDLRRGQDGEKLDLEHPWMALLLSSL